MLALRGLKSANNLLWQGESEILSTVETRREVLRVRVEHEKGRRDWWIANVLELKCQ